MIEYTKNQSIFDIKNTLQNKFQINSELIDNYHIQNTDIFKITISESKFKFLKNFLKKLNFILLEKVIIGSHENKRNSNNLLKVIFIYQPFLGKFNIEFVDSIFFKTLEEEIQKTINNRINKNFISERITSALIESNGEIIEIATQNIDLHKTFFDDLIKDKLLNEFKLNQIDLNKINEFLTQKNNSICIREVVKYICKDLSQSQIIFQDNYYSICPGCDYSNHAEAVLYSKVINNFKKDINEFKNLNLYLNNHFWICKSCSQKLENIGIKNIYLNKKWAIDFFNITKIF